MNNRIATVEKHVVMKMKEIKRQKRVFLTGTLFRSVIGARGFDESECSRKEIVHANSSGTDYYNHQTITTALMEAEYRKAEALRRQRSQFIC